MKSNNSIISIENKAGLNKYAKVSYPARYGKYTEIIAHAYIYEFDLTGRIKFITGRGEWPHGDWLKHTKGCDWVFYTAGEYSNIFPYTGEYYTPCLDYASNPFFPYRPFESRLVMDAISSLHSLINELKRETQTGIPEETIRNIIINERFPGKKLLDIAGEISVLPPDARHSDYDVIPLIAADGCVYNCNFCSVKSGNKVSGRSIENIRKQTDELKDFYGDDIINYNSIFLGNHDPFNAETSVIDFALNESYGLIKNSYMKGANLYAFSSIFSFLNLNDDFFAMLNDSPFQTYINIGFESFDQTTLDLIGKPIKANESKDAFLRLIDINKRYSKIELTSNFVVGSDLPVSHIKQMQELINSGINGRYAKGNIYLSPLMGEQDNAFVKTVFRAIKTSIKIPVYMYLIQRL